jgi:branched-chain amino acid transport system ATP-binding protein
VAEVAAVATTPLLSTHGLSRSFGGLKAVEAVDFDLMQGEIRAVIGPNGAGKTTFVSLVAGRVAPTAGRIVFDGRDITKLPAHRRVGIGIAYTFQITSIYPALSVSDNVALAAQHHAGGAELKRAVADALARVDLSGRSEELAGNLSYGHQRLLEVAMGLALRPRLLILDEPTQGLSDAEIKGFIALVREIAREATVMLIEHNMSVVMALADSITVMDRGRILAEGTPEEIRANAAVQEAYLGKPEEAAYHG